MGVERSLLYNSSGTINGSYVYMLLCRDSGPLYVKVGITDRPHQRILELVNGCPVSPRIFATVEVSNRKYALSLEQSLLDGFVKWRKKGEWISLQLEEKPEFNAAWKEIFGIYKKRWRAWRGKWDQVPVQPLIARANQIRQMRRGQYKRMGNAGRDFLKHGGRI